MVWTKEQCKRFYDSAVWARKREQILRRDHYECQDCRERLKRAAATGEPLIGWERRIHKARQVHHIQELAEHPELALVDSNLISLCPMCHNIRHGRDPIYWKSHQFLPKKRITDERW